VNVRPLNVLRNPLSPILISFHLQALIIPIVPELRIYRFFEEPIGPHPIAMFEVNLFTPAQFGAFIPWLVINRGPLSALVHPNCVDPVTGNHEEQYRDHTQRATWLGQPVPLDLGMFHEMRRKKEQKAAEKKNGLVTGLKKEE
jgi:aromatic ring-cleaving dioxygenase